MTLAKISILWLGGANTIIKGAVVGAVIGLCTEAVANAFQATIAILQSMKRGNLSDSATSPRSSEPRTGDMQDELQQLLDVALESPQQLLTGRHSRALRRVLNQIHTLQNSSGELPWQLFVIHQRLESAIESMPYDELYSLFGGNPPPNPVSEYQLRKLPTCKVSQLQQETGSSMNTCCPICLQDFANNDKVCALPGCQHTYHRQCVTKWLRIRGDCPVCRQLVDSASA